MEGLDKLSKEELLKKLEESEAEKASYKQQLDDTDAVVADLKKEVELKKNMAAPVTVTRGKKKFRFTSDTFILPKQADGIQGHEYSAKEVAENDDKTPGIVDELLRRQSSILEEVTTK